MLKVKKVNERLVVSIDWIAEKIIRTMFPYSQQILDVPFVQKVNQSSDGSYEMFCYEHQYFLVIEGDTIKLNGSYHYEKDEIRRVEKALVLLNPNTLEIRE